MRFDTAKALGSIKALGDPRFAGPDGETHIADFVEQQFESMGLHVDRREAVGSPVPQRLAPWIGWIGFAVPLTAIYLMALSDNHSWPTVLAGNICSTVLGLLAFR